MGKTLGGRASPPAWNDVPDDFLDRLRPVAEDPHAEAKRSVRRGVRGRDEASERHRVQAQLRPHGGDELDARDEAPWLSTDARAAANDVPGGVDASAVDPDTDRRADVGLRGGRSSPCDAILLQGREGLRSPVDMNGDSTDGAPGAVARVDDVVVEKRLRIDDRDSDRSDGPSAAATVNEAVFELARAPDRNWAATEPKELADVVAPPRSTTSVRIGEAPPVTERATPVAVPSRGPLIVSPSTTTSRVIASPAMASVFALSVTSSVVLMSAKSPALPKRSPRVQVAQLYPPRIETGYSRSKPEGSL